MRRLLRNLAVLFLVAAFAAAGTLPALAAPTRAVNSEPATITVSVLIENPFEFWNYTYKVKDGSIGSVKEVILRLEPGDASDAKPVTGKIKPGQNALRLKLTTAKGTPVFCTMRVLMDDGSGTSEGTNFMNEGQVIHYKIKTHGDPTIEYTKEEN